MSKTLVKFVILFDNTNLLYFPGQFLSGRVILELNDETPLLGLHFHVVGEGVVKLRNRKQQGLHDKENYIDFRMRLLGDPGQPPVVLSPGIHSFPFKLGLPLGLPSTFLGKHGWVQYYCKATIREESGFIHKNQQVFIVMNPVDLNLEPEVLSKPFGCDVEHKFRFTCLSSGSVACHVMLNKGGYVSGEAIDVTAVIHNKSRLTIQATKAALIETVKYMSRNKVVRTEVREMARVTKGKIQPGEVAKWQNEQIYIPPLPPSNLHGCHLIHLEYNVYFIVYPKGLQKEVKVQLPILIATYPYRSDDESLSGKEGIQYPTTLPIFRPSLDEKVTH